MPVILIILLATYGGIAIGRIPGLKLNRIGIALLGAIAMMVFGRISTLQTIATINWPTILLLFGFFVISAQLRLSGFYSKIAELISSRLGHSARFLLILMVAAGGLSAILNNDIVCYVFAPIVGAAFLRRRVNPTPYLIALAMASNIGAAATLVGNPQNIMIGAVAHLSFGRYLLWSIIPVIFAMGAAYGLIWALAKDRFESTLPPDARQDDAAPVFDRAHATKGLVILVLVIGLFFSPLPKEVVALAAAGIHLASRKFKTEDLLAMVDWPVLVLFMSLFVVTGAFESAGYGNAAAGWMARHQISLQLPHHLVAATAVLTSVMGNSPAVMLLLKMVPVSRPQTAYLLAVANSFSGNLILTGSVANLIVIQQARTLGIDISFRDYARLGIPATLAALAGLIGWAAWMG